MVWRAAALLLAGALTACGASTHPASPSASPAPSTTSTTTTAPAALAVTSAAPVAAAPVNHCARNTAAQLVLVDLSKQHLWMCARHRTVRDTPITSGMLGQYTETPTGHYVIQGRNTDTTLTLRSGATYAVQYWIPFDAPLFGFHDSSWQDFAYGSPKYKTDGSHGCVHMPLKQIRFLYHWVKIGTAVSIHA